MQGICIPPESQKLRVLFESQREGGSDVLDYCFAAVVFQFLLKEARIPVSRHHCSTAAMTLLQQVFADGIRNNDLSHCQSRAFPLQSMQRKMLLYTAAFPSPSGADWSLVSPAMALNLCLLHLQ